MQGIAARFAQRQTSSESAKMYANMFPVIALLAIDTLERSEGEGAYEGRTAKL